MQIMIMALKNLSTTAQTLLGKMWDSECDQALSGRKEIQTGLRDTEEAQNFVSKPH